MTVLFADLSGFTSYSERHAPTEVVELLNAVWTAAVPVVAAEDGLIENFTGDGLLVVFNAVGDQPDHPQRAVRVAIGLRDAIEALGAQRPEAMPRFHIGINTGPAFVGSVGAAGRRSFGAIGDTTNLGSRLLGRRGSGEIVVGEATWARLGGLVGGSCPWSRCGSRASASRSAPGALVRLDPTRPHTNAAGFVGLAARRGSGRRSGTRGEPRPACRTGRGASARHRAEPREPQSASRRRTPASSWPSSVRA